MNSMMSPAFMKKFTKILIVDDDSVLRKALADKIKERGYTALEAGTANDANVLIANEKPDALVLDLILPAKDGISYLEELRASGFTEPVVVLSNLAGSDELRNDATRLGASFYNKSSFTLDEIVTAVENTL